MYVQLINGPNDGQWIGVPEDLPSTVLMPLGAFWAGIDMREYDFSPVSNAEYRKEYGYWISDDGVEHGVRYKYVGVSK